jgi:hypothetical protein
MSIDCALRSTRPNLGRSPAAKKTAAKPRPKSREVFAPAMPDPRDRTDGKRITHRNISTNIRISSDYFRIKK